MRRRTTPIGERLNFWKVRNWRLEMREHVRLNNLWRHRQTEWCRGSHIHIKLDGPLVVDTAP